MKYRYIIFLCLFFQIHYLARSNQADSTWVDSVFHSLSKEQRIAQLFIIRGYSCKDSVYTDSLVKIIEKYNVGGICFFKGSPTKQANLTNLLQQKAQTPLLIMMDAEWGLGMRLDSGFSFPRQMTLGAMRDDSMIYSMGKMVAKNCSRLGIHVNLAPVADVNNNPKNPVISFRSFGENPAMVARKSIFYMKGMQDQGLFTTAKHFPGHGDTDIDSHLDLPVISHSKQRMDSIELLPFRELIREGVKGVLIAHLYLPCYDSILNTPATLSENVVTGLLKEKLGFKGFVITDALDMQGVTKYFPPGEIEVKALQAGNDILLLPKDVEIAEKKILTAIDSGEISKDLVETKCKQILLLKKGLGLAKRPIIDTKNLVADLNTPEEITLRQKMVNASVTVVKNNLRIIPLTGLDRRKIAVVSLGDTINTVFQTTMQEYATLDLFNVSKKITKQCSDSLCTLLVPYDLVIIGVHSIISNPGEKYGLSPSLIHLLDTLILSNRTILALFGTPYALSIISNLKKAEAIVIGYQDNPYTEHTVAEIIFGGIAAQGRLPVTSMTFPYGTGEDTEKSRLEFVQPEEIGIPSEPLRIIDSMALKGIEMRAYPGCQVLFAKNGKVFYEKSFGHPRYEDTMKVSTTQLFDLASVTKVAATTLAIMKLYDEGKLKTTDSLGTYLPWLKGSNKAFLQIANVMTHQAGLQDWIPFYKSTLKNNQVNPEIYQPHPSGDYTIRVAEDLYMNKKYQDTILKQIINSPLRSSSDYKYSDLGFYLLRFVVEKVSGKPFDKYLGDNFYKPLGLRTMGFNPRARFSLAGISPTEYDTIFRKQLIWGDVHDPGAAMLGGVSGHAGLFSDALDLAVILQMILQEGFYGNKQYFSAATVNEFTKVQFPQKGNRRGLGFDKPLHNFAPNGPACEGASKESFGHSGFTGTYCWADPENGLVYIFLSNRVFPSASNQRLSEMNIRTNIHQAMYDILEKYRIK
ncbi:MAG: glycoside hydrolase family 3 N-terminal domain-containing protein [Bacteroidales bacterium]|nr:glycoside hydrolase family 3 N-terminal domain-containing protein [Bacteroidales bacterium]